MKLLLHGATGRVGLAITRLAHNSPEFAIVGAVCSSVDPGQGRDIGELAGVGPMGVVATADLGSGLLGADCIIDFSVPSAVPGLLAIAARQHLPVVSGTTSLDSAGRQALEKAAESIPVLWAPNMSLGIQVLAELVTHALRRLGSGYDPEIVEIHHRRKLDAPSGTAGRLADAVRSARSDVEDVHGRVGEVGLRSDHELGLHAVRGGDVVGDHTVYLLGPGERLELTHRATSRELFAHGALRAARFVAKHPPGLYSMADVLERAS